MTRWVSCLIPGTPPSLNELPINTRDPRYRRARNAWAQNFAYAMCEAGNRLAAPLDRVEASAVLAFPQRRRRDTGNYRSFIEKVLGDTLQHTHRLADDTPDRFAFGAVEFTTGGPSTILILDYTPALKGAA